MFGKASYRFALAALLLLCGLSLQAKRLSVAALREMSKKGTPFVTDVHSNRVFLDHTIESLRQPLDAKLSVEGYVCASAFFPYHSNNDIPFQNSFQEVSVSVAMSTAYLMSMDGKCGIRLVFGNERQCRALKTYSVSEISLKGATLVRDGDCVSVLGLTDKNIIYSEVCDISDIPVRELTIGELTPEDIYCFVRLKDCEFVLKDGPYTPVIEDFMVRSVSGRNFGSNTGDDWGKLLVDSRGDKIFMHMNTKFPYRRVGGGVPRGRGSIEGIIVDSYLPRYGRMDCYGIRPVGEKSIQIEWQGAPGFGTIAAWNWNKPSTGLIPAEVGRGAMLTDCPGSIGRTCDSDNPLNDAKGERADSRGIKGRVDDGALQIVARSCDWWNWDTDTPRSLMLIVSTRGLSGSGMFVDFTFSAGDSRSEHSYGYPSYWGVSWSLDGRTWERCSEPDATLRSLPIWFPGRPVAEVDGERYIPSAECALGFSEFLFNLPPSLLGRDRVFIKIHPTRKVMAGLGYLMRDNHALLPTSEELCYVNFGDIIVGYRQ